MATKRSELRDRLRRIAQVNTTTSRLTSLGMHFMPAQDDSPVLVSIEVNVPRLLAILQNRICQSKHGQASVGKGAIRVSLATAEARETCGALRSSQGTGRTSHPS